MIRLLIVLTLALGPIQWITIADVGLILKPVHIPFFIFSAYGWFTIATSKCPLDPIRSIYGFLLPYAAYLVFFAISITATYQNINLFMKYSLYFIGFMGFFFGLVTINFDSLKKSVYWGGVGASFVFVIVAYITLKMRGFDLFGIVIDGIRQGNVNDLQFKIFRNLFNTVGYSETEAVGVALRHTVMGFIYISLFISLANWKHTHIAKISFFLALSIIIISVSRSLVLATLIGLAPYILYSMKAKPIKLLVYALSAAATCIMLVYMGALGGISKIISSRFGSISEDGRTTSFGKAIGAINENPLLGNGIGYEIQNSTGLKSHQIHNLFLASWAEAGIFAFICALSFTGFVLYKYSQAFREQLVNPSYLSLSGLAILPVFRSQISGGGGNYTLPEWICLAVFFAFLAKDDATKSFSSHR